MTSESVADLSLVRLGIRRHDVFGPGPWRLLAAVAAGQEAPCSPTGLARIVEAKLPFVTLEETLIPVHVLTTDVLTGQAQLISEATRRLPCWRVARFPACSVRTPQRQVALRRSAGRPVRSRARCRARCRPGLSAAGGNRLRQDQPAALTGRRRDARGHVAPGAARTGRGGGVQLVGRPAGAVASLSARGVADGLPPRRHLDESCRGRHPRGCLSARPDQTSSHAKFLRLRGHP